MDLKTKRTLERLKDADPAKRAETIEALTGQQEDWVVDALEHALEDRNPEVRLSAVSALGETGGPRAEDVLIRALEHRDPEVQMWAAERLGMLCSKRAVASLSEVLLGAADDLLRTYVADSLGSIGDRRALPALIVGLNDRDSLVRGHSALALAEIGDERVISKLEEALRREKSSLARVSILSALFMLGRPEVLPEILKRLRSRSYRVRCATANLLAGMDNDANRQMILEVLEDALKNEETIAARSSLSNSLSEIRSRATREG